MYHSPNLRLYRVYIQLFSTLFSIFSFFFFVLCYFFPSLVILCVCKDALERYWFRKRVRGAVYFFLFLNVIFFLASDERALKIFTENNFCWILKRELRLLQNPPLPKSSLAGDIAAFVIKMHRPASAPANKNAFHGWLNLIVLSARTEGISVFG